ncbi:putative glutamate receptor ionotropic, kainate 2-like 22, partial [Homarus americanus]
IGAPFRHRLDLKLQRLLEAGLITFWMDDVISTHVRHTRRQQFQGSGDNIVYNEDDGQVVLSLHHLQVTFYLLLLGHVLGLITFLLEHILHRFC